MRPGFVRRARSAVPVWEEDVPLRAFARDPSLRRGFSFQVPPWLAPRAQALPSNTLYW
jgi:hypothetical protein